MSPQNILITGASRGLGAALARECFARGHRLFLGARSEAALAELARVLGGAEKRSTGYLATDLARPESCRLLADRATQHLGQIDVLINNAGTGTYKPFLDWGEGEIIDTLSLNLVAPMLLSHAVLPQMLQRGRGSIINVASDLARRPLANMAPYVGSKFGVLGFGASLHREVRARGIKVTTVLPGIIDTSFNGAVEGSKDSRWALSSRAVAGSIADLLDLPDNVVIDECTIHPAQGDY